MKLLAQDGGGVYEHIRDSNLLEYTPNMMPDHDNTIRGVMLTAEVFARS